MGRRDREGFHSSQGVLSHALRRKMAQNVTVAVEQGLGFVADQCEIWDGISARLAAAGTDSATHAWATHRESRRHDLAEIGRTFRPVERRVGFVAMLGDEIVGLEALGRSEAFASSFQSLVRAYAIEAIDAGLLRETRAQDQGTLKFDAPEPFIAALASAPVRWGRSLGLGSDVRVDAAGVSACALGCDGLVHLTAFPAEATA
ncbi:MAG: DUF6569 family protein [Myxococcota bacterium]|nr:DUF6569 family protein [Myxococcota bacterium]